MNILSLPIIGTLTYNLVLGENRARTAKRYLEDLGISVSRLMTLSYGKEEPFSKDHNEDRWITKRRAHFVVQQCRACGWTDGIRRLE
ncbi:MAG: OmpA family protein [Nitrospirales bacterium]